MEFVISNFKFGKAKKIGELFYDGTCIKQVGEDIKIAQSANCRFFSKYDYNLERYDICQQIEYDDFYFVAEYRTSERKIYMQTDLVAYEEVYIYNKNGVFVFSDDLLYLVQLLNEFGYKVNFNEKAIREFLYFGRPLFKKCIFEDISILQPASIFTVKLPLFEMDFFEYNHFVIKQEYNTLDEASAELDIAIDKYFSSHYQKDKEYGIGLSGGLDSRVGAYYAKKHKYNLYPYFIGKEKNRVGILTNDVVRAKEVSQILNLGKVNILNPLNMPLREKVQFETLHSCNGGNNIAQCLGKLEGFDIIIHGMIGGELFGSLVPNDIDNYNVQQLAEYLLFRIMSIPRYKVNSAFGRRLLQYISLPKAIKERYELSDEVKNKIVSQQHLCDLMAQMEEWILEQRQHSMNNINILQKYFYYNMYSSKRGYYSTNNGTKPSLPLYHNPLIIREMLKWDTEFLKRKQLQAHFISQLGDLDSVRSQTFEMSIRNQKEKKGVYRILPLVERMIRGGAMVYTEWYKKTELKKYCEKYIKDKTVWELFPLEEKIWYGQGMRVLFSLFKIAYIEECLNIEIASEK